MSNLISENKIYNRRKRKRRGRSDREREGKNKQRQSREVRCLELTEPLSPIQFQSRAYRSPWSLILTFIKTKSLRENQH